MKKLTIFLFLLFPFCLFGGTRYEKDKIVVSNDFEVMSNAILHGVIYVFPTNSPLNNYTLIINGVGTSTTNYYWGTYVTTNFTNQVNLHDLRVDGNPVITNLPFIWSGLVTGNGSTNEIPYPVSSLYGKTPVVSLVTNSSSDNKMVRAWGGETSWYYTVETLSGSGFSTNNDTVTYIFGTAFTNYSYVAPTSPTPITYIMTFIVSVNSTNNPPIITAATITNGTTDCIFTNYISGATTNTKSPPYDFFTNAVAGIQYGVIISTQNWGKVTRLTFQQASPRAFLTAFDNSPVAQFQTGVTALTSAFYRNTNHISWSFGIFTNVNSIGSAWQSNPGQKYAFPEINTMSKINDISSAWRDDTSMTGAFPSVTGLTNVTTAANAWDGCTAEVESFPEVSTMTKVASLVASWRNSTAFTNQYPSITALASVISLSTTWSGCSLAPTLPDSANPLYHPQITTYHDFIQGCTNMKGNWGGWTWINGITDFDTYNTYTSYTNRPGCLASGVKTNGFTIRCDNSHLVEGDVDQILIDLDTSGATNGTVNVGGTTAGQSNAWASASGSNAAVSLRAKAWNVTGNGI